MLVHRRRALADAGFAVPAEIWHDQAVFGGECFGYWQPEFVMRREWMQEDNGAPITDNPIHNFRITAADVLRGMRFHAGIKSQPERGHRGVV
jgi:hypothetical protein